MKVRLLISAWARLAAVLAALVVLAGPAVAGSGNVLVLNVVAAGGAGNVVPSPASGPGPFYIPGDIFDPGTGDLIGKFHFSGFFINGGAQTSIDQEFDLFDRGKIQVAGIEGKGPRAITGGTGEFDNARGAVTGASLSSYPNFSVTVRLLGTE